MTEQIDSGLDFVATRKTRTYLPRALVSFAWPMAAMATALAALDVLVVTLAALGSYFARFGEVAPPGHDLAAILLGVLLTVGGAHFAGAYKRSALGGYGRLARPILTSWIAVFLFLIVLAFVGKISAQYSRAWAINWFVFSAAGFLVVRAGVPWVCRRLVAKGSVAVRVALVGPQGGTTQIRDNLLSQYGSGVEIVGSHILHNTDEESGMDEMSKADLISEIQCGAVDLILIKLTRFDDQFRKLLDRLRMMSVRVCILPDLPDLGLRVRNVELIGEHPALEIVAPPLDGRGYVLKLALEWTLIVLMIPFLAPLMLIIAVAIRFDSPGSVIFTQTRNGLNNREINIHKFRTMRASAATESNFRQACPGDDRVTRVGRFLRRTSLDELPQLFNVIKGDLALVGPRPQPILLNEKFVDVVESYAARHRVKPGVTGWAQVNGWRGETDTAEKMSNRVEHDLYYVENWSLAFDLKILVLTFLTVLKGDNAH